MGYDYRTGSSSVAGSVAPIAGPTYDIGDTIRAYLSRIPASKIILGVPYYGRAWSTVDVGAQRQERVRHQERRRPTTVVYGTAVQFAADHGRKWDATEGVAWTVYRRRNCTATYGCVNPWRELYYDDAKALGLKYDLVNHYDLRGAGIWALGYDGTRTELYATLKAKFITDTVPPVITASSLSNPLVSPNGDGRLDTVTVRVTATGLIRYGWTVQPIVNGVVGSAVRTGGAPGRAATFTWDGKDNSGRIVRDGAVPDHGLDRRRIEQPCRGREGRHRRPPPRGRHGASLVQLHLAQRRWALRPHDPVDDRRFGDHRIGPGARFARHDRPPLGVHQGDERFVDLERPEQCRHDRGGRQVHVPDRRARPGRQPDDPRHPGHGRPDDPVGVVVARLVRAEGRPARTRDVRPAAGGDGHGVDPAGLHGGARDLDGEVAQRGQLRLDLERPDGFGRAGQARHVPGRRPRQQLDRDLVVLARHRRPPPVTPAARRVRRAHGPSD